ncbi:hypothetical protein GcM3_025043 [Golovinomyces cichoracearum]|uniref:Uncharacterized protein n=1 Tax=Golovinomyces cichoracearum TaxID=62708 RepID=A0A420J6J3_9PEZI|nr:hypothetical protein GcM3_025043 [Golovinomyces cichoracearum]
MKDDNSIDSTSLPGESSYQSLDTSSYSTETFGFFAPHFPTPLATSPPQIESIYSSSLRLFFQRKYQFKPAILHRSRNTNTEKSSFF